MKTGEVTTAAYEHPFIVRLCHWVNAVALFVMIGSGLQIFRAFSSFGPRVPEKDIIDWPKSLALGGWLGGALQWHLTFVWIYIASGVLYVGYEIFSGNYKQILFTHRDVPGVWPMVRHYFFFGPKPPLKEAYNPLQKHAYTSVIGLGVLSVLTGFAVWKPVQFSWLAWLMGGFHLGSFMAFSGDVGDYRLLVRASGDGGAAWMEQFRFHADRMEEERGIRIGIASFVRLLWIRWV